MNPVAFFAKTGSIARISTYVNSKNSHDINELSNFTNEVCVDICIGKIC